MKTLHDTSIIDTIGAAIFKYFAPIAQLVEQLPLKETVLGSIPSGCTNEQLAEITKSRHRRNITKQKGPGSHGEKKGFSRIGHLVIPGRTS